VVSKRWKGTSRFVRGSSADPAPQVQARARLGRRACDVREVSPLTAGPAAAVSAGSPPSSLRCGRGAPPRRAPPPWRARIGEVLPAAPPAPRLATALDRARHAARPSVSACARSCNGPRSGSTCRPTDRQRLRAELQRPSIGLDTRPDRSSAPARGVATPLGRARHASRPIVSACARSCNAPRPGSTRVPTDRQRLRAELQRPSVGLDMPPDRSSAPAREVATPLVRARHASRPSSSARARSCNAPRPDSTWLPVE
jgi:hypothetical protein